jgi:hypothetical protein
MPIEVAMSLLGDVFCEPGGGIDEGIVSHAWTETILRIVERGDINIETISSPEQWTVIIQTFIAESICQRIINDIGNKIVAMPQDIEAVNSRERQVRDIVMGSVADAIPPLIEGNNRQPDRVLQAEIQGIYEHAFGFLEQLNEEEE